MRYLLLHCYDESREVGPGEAEAAGRELEGWLAETIPSGVNLHGSRLRPPSDATTVRRRGSELIVTDGPYAETKEVVAGYDVVECRDLEHALEVAARHPTARLGSIEVRPFHRP